MVEGEKKVRKVIRRGGNTVVISQDHAERGLHSQVATEKGAKVKLIPLSGMCEDGSTTWILEYGEEIIIIDGGVPYSANHSHEEEALEVDISYLIKNKNKIRAYLISHGHEDQIAAAVPILKALSIPVLYGPPLAIRLLEEKIKGLGLKVPMSPIKPRQALKIGSLVAIYFKNTHSIFDSYSIIIHTPVGRIVYTGDFKLDYTPVDKEQFDFYSLLQAGEDGVLALISDSTNSQQGSYTPSESSVFSYLEKAFKKADGKILISTFASQVCRIKQIIEIAEKLNKKIAIVDDSILELVKICKELGYMKFVDSSLVDFHDIPKIPEKKLVVLTASAQFDNLSPLNKMAFDEHIYVTIKKDDTVLISAMPSERNDRTFINIINALKVKGAHVFYGVEDKIYVSGHGAAQEKKTLLNMVKPKFFIPARGDWGDLYRHRGLAIECGVNPKNILLINNYDVLELSADTAKVIDSVIPSKGKSKKANVELEDNEVSLARQKLSTGGLITALITMKSGKIAADPEISFSGIPAQATSFTSKIVQALKSSVEKNKTSKPDVMKHSLESELLTLSAKQFKKEPLVQVMILEI